jgi:uncharacterized protein (TIGR03435 family)
MFIRVLFFPAFLFLNLSGQQTPLEFEVTSIKPDPTRPYVNELRNVQGRPAPRSDGNRFREPRATLQWLIMEAYGLQKYEIVGLPDWAEDYFDVEAIAPEAKTPTTEELQGMIQSLLAKRFGLKTHRGSKRIPVYALVSGKNGTKLRPLRDDEELSRGRTASGALTRGRWAVMLDLIRFYADRPVVDETGLKGNYEQATIIFNEFSRARWHDPQGTWDSVYALIKSKWGLEVKARVDSIEVLVIDHVELPSAND